MTTSPNPYIELLHSDITPSAIQQTESRFLGSPAQQIEAALSTYRLLMINHVKDELRKKSSITSQELLRMADLASQLYLGRFTTLVGPTATTAYLQAYRSAARGEVPVDLVYALANQHAERMGKYFHETSREALVQGFNRLVNTGVPARVAAERVMDAFGLTPRQMSGYVALAPAQKTNSSISRNLKAKALDYIGRSIRRRLKVFGRQEEHNLSQQAQQVVWMWELDKGMLSSLAQKVWLTARDERVCKVCGPMHGKKVGVTERFTMPDGSDIYVPGAHVNCRCTVKLLDPITQVAKADWEENEHPRAHDGRFKNKYSVATRTKPASTFNFQHFLDTAQTTQPIDIDAPLARPVGVFRPIDITVAKPVDVAPLTKPIDIVRTLIDIPGPQTLDATATPTGELDGERPVDVPPTPPRKPRSLVDRLPHPIYAVLGKGDFTPGSFQYDLRSQTFYPDKLTAVAQATAKKREYIEEALNDLFGDETEVIVAPVYDPALGRVHSEFDENQMREVFESLADESGHDRDQYFPVEMYNEDHEWVGTKQMTAREIGEVVGTTVLGMGYEPDDFAVRVLEVQNVHANESDRGGWDHYARAHGHSETFKVDGPYETVAPEWHEKIHGYSIGTDIYPIEPYDPQVI